MPRGSVWCCSHPGPGQGQQGRKATAGMPHWVTRRGLRCGPPSIWQGSAPGCREGWPRAGQAAPTWRAAVDEERQACGQAEAGQESHRSWGETHVSSSTSPEGRGGVRRPRGQAHTLCWGQPGRDAPSEHPEGVCPMGSQERNPTWNEKPPRQRWSPGSGDREKGCGRRLPLSLSSRLAVPESSSVQSEFSGNKITGHG